MHAYSSTVFVHALKPLQKAYELWYRQVFAHCPSFTFRQALALPVGAFAKLLVLYLSLSPSLSVELKPFKRYSYDPELKSTRCEKSSGPLLDLIVMSH
jgi:hypothetical protein